MVRRCLSLLAVSSIVVFAVSNSAIASSAADVVATEVNLPVPFTTQAPAGTWDATHKTASEEASIAMVLRYFDSSSFADIADADKQITHLVELNAKTLGYGTQQTAQQVAAMLAKENGHVRISMVNPTADAFKKALSKGFLAIAPVSGSDLGTPYSPMPDYHILVIRGYTKDGHVITNDPATTKGDGLTYSWTTLINAIHDWNGRNLEAGEKVAILIGPYKIVNFDKKASTSKKTAIAASAKASKKSSSPKKSTKKSAKKVVKKSATKSKKAKK